jgi:hypothetical protein
VIVCFMFNELRWEVIVCFVNVGGIVDHYFLNSKLSLHNLSKQTIK